MKPQVEISITKLTEQVNAGMRKKGIAEFYNIPEFQVGKLLKQANLKIKKIHAPAFVLISDKQVEDVTFTETPEYVDAEKVLLFNEEDEELTTHEDLIQKQAEIGKGYVQVIPGNN